MCIRDRLTAADEISVEVHQKIRLEYDPPKFPTQVYICLLYTSSVPFTTARKVIFGSAIGLFFLCLIFLSSFFDIAPISLPQAVVVLAITAVMPFLMKLVEKGVGKWADKILSKKLIKKGLSKIK